MNNIRKFEDFLDKMQGLIDNAKKQGHIIVPIEDIENTFPELKEREDERIRKAIINIFATHKDYEVYFGVSVEDICVWLERQGNQTIFNTPSRETILAIWELGNDWKELTNGVISTEHGTQLDYIQKHWSESEHYLREKRKHEPASNEQQGKSALKSIHEQKPNNKPKFKVGDWITNGNCKYQITFIDSRYWYSETCVLGDVESIDKKFHLWTVQDAKDGDVLSYENEVFIVKKSVNLNILYYCCYDGEHFIINSFYSLTIDDINNIRPATKEQRNLLFAKMKEAGYEWDAEKKKLSKRVIDEGKAEMDYCFTKMMNGEKVSSAWSEEDAFRTSALTDVVKSGGSIRPELRNEFVDWLKSLKDRVQPQLKQELSEEDNKWIESLIQTFEDGYFEGFNQLESYGVIDWLKSLKNKYENKSNI